MITKRRSKLPVVLLTILVLIAAVAAAAEGAYLGACALGRFRLESAAEELHGDGLYFFRDGESYRFREDIQSVLILGTEKKNGETEVLSLRLCTLCREKETLKIVSISPKLETNITLRDKYGAAIGTELAPLKDAYAQGVDDEDSRELLRHALSSRLRGLPICGVIELDDDSLHELLLDIEQGAGDDPAMLLGVLWGALREAESDLGRDSLVYLAAQSLLHCEAEQREIECAAVSGRGDIVRAEAGPLYELLNSCFCKKAK